MKTIPLSRGKVAFVDDSDFGRVSQFKWTFLAGAKPHYAGYAHRHIKIGNKWKHQKMHHFILGTTRRTDHRDGNGLNNQRKNLRACTHQENLRNMRIHNKHGYKGIALLRGGQKKPWVSKITYRKKLRTLGFFSTAVEAARAYNNAALDHFGEFANLNPL